MILSLIALISSLLNLFDNRLFVRIDGFDPTRFVEITTYDLAIPPIVLNKVRWHSLYADLVYSFAEVYIGPRAHRG